MNRRKFYAPVWLISRVGRQKDRFRQRVGVGVLTGGSRANAILKLEAAGVLKKIINFDISSFGESSITRLSLL